MLPIFNAISSTRLCRRLTCARCHPMLNQHGNAVYYLSLECNCVPEKWVLGTVIPARSGD